MIKKILLATILASAAVFSIAEKSLSQVDYRSHPYTPVVEGSDVYRYATINIRSGYVNGRQFGSTGALIISSFFPGQQVHVDYVIYNPSDGYFWYYVHTLDDSQYGWVRGDLLRFN